MSLCEPYYTGNTQRQLCWAFTLPQKVKLMFVANKQLKYFSVFLCFVALSAHGEKEPCTVSGHGLMSLILIQILSV